MISTEERLKAFQEENNIYTKGPLSLVVQFTRLVHTYFPKKEMLGKS